MSIAKTIQACLSEHKVGYEIVLYPKTTSAMKLLKLHALNNEVDCNFRLADEVLKLAY